MGYEIVHPDDLVPGREYCVRWQFQGKSEELTGEFAGMKTSGRVLILVFLAKRTAKSKSCPMNLSWPNIIEIKELQ